MMTRVRVSGNCEKSLEEDICSRIPLLMIKTVVIANDDEFIQFELADCTSLSASVLASCSSLDLMYNRQIFVFHQLLIATAPIHFQPAGIQYIMEPSVALRFLPQARLN